MSGEISGIITIAGWEIRRSLTSMNRGVMPVAIGLFVLLIAAMGFAADSGIHLQDGIYTVGVDSPEAAQIFSGDDRFFVYQGKTDAMVRDPGTDLIIVARAVYYKNTDRSASALKALEKDYLGYKAGVYNKEVDLFAAYPLWIDLKNVKSELDFVATQEGQQISPGQENIGEPLPSGPVEKITEPPSAPEFSREELRERLISAPEDDGSISRYNKILSPGTDTGDFTTPSQITPPLPLDSIILIFVFIFPLYFTSQFYMMSIMNERVDRKGEILLSTPLRPWQIIIGKGLPYFAVMIGISAGIALFNGASLLILLPLIPVILFFMASALIIGMVARSFRELSFLSIFFSTVATSYIFFPSIFANVHIVSLISPLTLIIYQMQGDGFTLADYIFSTSLFFLVSGVLFYIGIRNFNEERLFSQHMLMPRLLDFIGSGIRNERPFLSLFVISALGIPFVFMAQMMLLVVLFNLPMPFSLVMLLISAACIEECAKSVGIYAMLKKSPGFLTWKNLVMGSVVIALGFLIGEKALLFATLAQISESVFGVILFSSLQVLWMPLLLHFAGIFTTSVFLKAGGRHAFIPGVMAATVVHTIYNMYFIMGWF